MSVRALPVGDELIGDYFQDPVFRERFQDWLNDLWREKDRVMDRLCLPMPEAT